MDATTDVNRMVGEIIGRVILKKVRILGVSSSFCRFIDTGRYCLQGSHD
ncbi:MAG: hypothetical protein ACLR0U_22630 [Enterocloster clostridioformis]